MATTNAQILKAIEALGERVSTLEQPAAQQPRKAAKASHWTARDLPCASCDRKFRTERGQRWHEANMH